MDIIKNIACNIIAALMAMPVVLYTMLRLMQAIMSCWKTGWDSRPFIYIGISGILVYVMYCAAITVALAWLWRLSRDKFVGACAIIVASMLGIFWVGLLSCSIGVLLP